MDRRGTLVVFVFSVLPNPVFDFVGIAAGSTHYPLRRFIAAVFAGKIIKDLVVAYTCSVLPWDSLLPWMD